MLKALRHIANILSGRFSKQMRADELLDSEREVIDASTRVKAQSAGLGVQIDLLVDQINRRAVGGYHDAPR